jgi:hypothetical protein
MAFRVCEDSLGPEVARLLEDLLGCPVAQQGVLPGRKKFDMFFDLEGHRIILELEIGAWQKLPVAVVQAEEYRGRIGADGIIALVYPETMRRDVASVTDVRALALSVPVTSIVLAPFLRDFYPQLLLSELAQKIKASLAQPMPSPSVSLVVETLRQSVRGIALEIQRSVGLDSPLMEETVGSLPLFQILSNEAEGPALRWEDEEKQKQIVADLASYIVVNQILLYRILSCRLGWERDGWAMKPVAAPIELKPYFQRVIAIDYRPVFCVNTPGTIPLTATPEVNFAIIAIATIQPENLSHDLLGRIFHEFLPDETRKQLGTFYTGAQAAEMLAALAIDRSSDKVLDPACGSGTLLVAAYRRKRSMGKPRPHWKVVGEDLTGVDIMPFAAHLTALNLTLQSPMEETERTRIGVGNALHLVPGGELRTTAQWLRTFGGEVLSVDEGEQKGDVFEVQPVDVVIMNPPFTRKERVTPEMKSALYSHLGEQNYWVYFVALADRLVKQKGRIAAVLPRDFFRGKYSRLIREYLFGKKQWGIRYIVKSTRDWAFSEQASFRDFLVVMERSYQAKIGLAYLKKPLDSLSLTEAGQIGEAIRLVDQGHPYSDDAVTVLWRDQDEVWDKCSDLGHLAVFNTEAGEGLLTQYRSLLAAGRDKLVRLIDSRKPELSVIRGFELGGENLQSLLYVVRQLNVKRTGRATWLLRSEGTDKITADVKGGIGTFDIPLQCVKRGIKTSAYVPCLDIGDCADYVIVKPFDGFTKVLQLHGVRGVQFLDVSHKAKARFTHLVVNRRFDFTAPGTRALAFFSQEKVLPVGLHWSILAEPEPSKVLCLWFNSVVYLVELLLSQTETRGSYMLITEEDLKQVHIPRLDIDTSGLIQAFDEVRQSELPPLWEQFHNPCPARLVIDRAVLSFLGYERAQAEKLLPAFYQALDQELKSVSELMKNTSRGKISEQAKAQLHLFPQD